MWIGSKVINPSFYDRHLWLHRPGGDAHVRPPVGWVLSVVYNVSAPLEPGVDTCRYFIYHHLLDYINMIYICLCVYTRNDDCCDSLGGFSSFVSETLLE